MQNPAKMDAALTKVSANDDCAALSPSADANATMPSEWELMYQRHAHYTY